MTIANPGGTPTSLLRVSVDGQQILLRPGDRLTVGSSRHVDITVNDPLCSRSHLLIDEQDGQWVAHDAGSQHGTYVDGEQIFNVAVDDYLRLTLGPKNGAVVKLQTVEEIPGTELSGSSDPVRNLEAKQVARRREQRNKWIKVGAACLALGLSLGIFAATRGADDTAPDTTTVEVAGAVETTIVAAPPATAAPENTITEPATPATVATLALTDAQQLAPSAATQRLAQLGETSAPAPTQFVRDDYGWFYDPDGDCQGTRHEVLIANSLEPLGFETDDQCIVITGRWVDPYTGVPYDQAELVAVQPVVALGHVHESGGWAWTSEVRQAYVNDTGHPATLTVVGDATESGKGKKGPDNWRPANSAYWCVYAIDWIDVKYRWTLTVTEAERSALLEMLSTCEPGTLPSDQRATADNQQLPLPSAADTPAPTDDGPPDSVGFGDTPPSLAGECSPNYGGCVPIASDVDCAGSTDDGPKFVNGPFDVLGNDIYDLDTDRDGIGCE